MRIVAKVLGRSSAWLRQEEVLFDDERLEDARQVKENEGKGGETLTAIEAGHDAAGKEGEDHASEEQQVEGVVGTEDATAEEVKTGSLGQTTAQEGKVEPEVTPQPDEKPPVQEEAEPEAEASPKTEEEPPAQGKAEPEVTPHVEVELEKSIETPNVTTAAADAKQVGTQTKRKKKPKKETKTEPEPEPQPQPDSRDGHGKKEEEQVKDELIAKDGEALKDAEDTKKGDEAKEDASKDSATIDEKVDLTKTPKAVEDAAIDEKASTPGKDVAAVEADKVLCKESGKHGRELLRAGSFVDEKDIPYLTQSPRRVPNPTKASRWQPKKPFPNRHRRKDRPPRRKN